MQKLLTVLTIISSSLLVTIGMYVNYLVFFPFDVLVVEDILEIEHYQETKPWYDIFRFVFVAPQTFGEPQKPVVAGDVIIFDAAYIYNFGEEPTYKAALRCLPDENGKIPTYSVATNGKELPLIGPPGVLRVGQSNYNIIDSRAKGQTCRIEFDTVYRLLFRNPITKTLVTPYFLVE